jgi:hypothetical protein
MTEMTAVAKLMARDAGTSVKITRERGFPVSKKPLVLIPIAMAGESPSLFGLGVGDGRGPVKSFVCGNPINRDEQYDMLAAAFASAEPTVLSWEMPLGELPQIIVTGADSARLALGVIDRSVYSQRPNLLRVSRRLAWFDKRSDCSDSASVLVLPKALATCLATGQDEFGDQHLGAFLEWCKPADGQIWQRVATAEQLSASGATSPEFDREHLAPAAEKYTEVLLNGDAPGAARAKKMIAQLIGDEIGRRYRSASEALRQLRLFPEGAVAQDIAAEDREAYLEHVGYVADPANHLRRSLTPEMQTSEFMSREFAVDRIAGLSIRSVSGAYAKAQLAGDLLEGVVVATNRQKIGRKTIVIQTISSSQHLSLRSGDKLCLLCDERFTYRIVDLAEGKNSGDMLVRAEVIAGKRLPGLPDVGDATVLVPPVRDRATLGRARGIAWDRMRACPAPVPAAGAIQVRQDLASAVAALRGKS